MCGYMCLSQTFTYTCIYVHSRFPQRQPWPSYIFPHFMLPTDTPDVLNSCWQHCSWALSLSCLHLSLYSSLSCFASSPPVESCLPRISWFLNCTLGVASFPPVEPCLTLLSWFLIVFPHSGLCLVLSITHREEHCLLLFSCSALSPSVQLIPQLDAAVPVLLYAAVSRSYFFFLLYRCSSVIACCVVWVIYCIITLN